MTILRTLLCVVLMLSVSCAKADSDNRKTTTPQESLPGVVGNSTAAQAPVIPDPRIAKTAWRLDRIVGLSNMRFVTSRGQEALTTLFLPCKDLPDCYASDFLLEFTDSMTSSVSFRLKTYDYCRWIEMTYSTFENRISFTNIPLPADRFDLPGDCGKKPPVPFDLLRHSCALDLEAGNDTMTITIDTTWHRNTIKGPSDDIPYALPRDSLIYLHFVRHTN